MKAYIMCPNCSARLGKAEGIKAFEYHCKCGAELLINAAESCVTVELISVPEKTKKVTLQKPSVSC